jgi:hypothetical protein
MDIVPGCTGIISGIIPASWRIFAVPEDLICAVVPPSEMALNV